MLGFQISVHAMPSANQLCDNFNIAQFDIKILAIMKYFYIETSIKNTLYSLWSKMSSLP